MKLWRGGTYSLLLLEGWGRRITGVCMEPTITGDVLNHLHPGKSKVQRRESRETRGPSPESRGESPERPESREARVQCLQRLEFRPVLCLLCNLSLLLLLVYHHKYLWFVPYATSENQAGMQPSPPSNKNPWRVSHGTVCVGASNSGATGGSVM